MTKAELARRLEVNRAVITRRLNGTSNMTLESLSDLAWALDKRVTVRLEDRRAAHGGNAAPATTATAYTVDVGGADVATTHIPMLKEKVVG